MLNKEFQYFLDHQGELVKKYKGKFIVIKSNKVIDYWDTFTDAYFNTQEQGHELGTFLIQECLPGEECYTTTLQEHQYSNCDGRDNLKKCRTKSLSANTSYDCIFFDEKLKNSIVTGKPTDGELTVSILQK